jgi:hypothetical protein
MAPRSIPCDHRAGVEDATATDRARTSIRAFLFSRALSVFLFSCPTQIESTYSDRPQLSCVRGFAHSARRADQTSRSGLHGTRDFAAGLTYVALSRLRCWGGLMLTQAVSAARMLLLKRMQTPGGCHAPLRRESWRADSCQAKACMQEQQSARGQYRLEQRAWRADSCQAKACRDHERSIQLRAGATGGDGRSGHPRHCFRPVSSDGMPMSDGGTATRSDLLRPSCDIYGHCKTVSSRIALPRCPPQHAPQPVGLPLASPDAAEYLVRECAQGCMIEPQGLRWPRAKRERAGSDSQDRRASLAVCCQLTTLAAVKLIKYEGGKVETGGERASPRARLTRSQ